MALIPLIASVVSTVPSILQATGVIGGTGGEQYGAAFGQPTPGLISPRDPAALRKTIARRRPELQTAGLAQVSPAMEAQMAGLTPEEWDLIVGQGGL